MKNEPAFPILGKFENKQTNTVHEYTLHGMSKRFYAACAAMQGQLSTQDDGALGMYLPPWDKLAEIAFEIADAMLKYEREHPEGGEGC